MGSTAVNTTTAITITVSERKAYAMKLRTAGLNYREIHQEMIKRYGKDALPSTYDERYAYRDVKAELDRLRSSSLDTAQDLRLLELDRLDQLQTAILGDALAGNLKAVDRVLKIMDHRAKLMGLFAPSKSQLEVSDWRSEIVQLIKAGKITVEQAEEELGKEFVAGLLVSGSTDVIEGEFADTAS